MSESGSSLIDELWKKHQQRLSVEQARFAMRQSLSESPQAAPASTTPSSEPANSRSHDNSSDTTTVTEAQSTPQVIAQAAAQSQLARVISMPTHSTERGLSDLEKLTQEFLERQRQVQHHALPPQLIHMNNIPSQWMHLNQIMLHQQLQQQHLQQQHNAPSQQDTARIIAPYEAEIDSAMDKFWRNTLEKTKSASKFKSQVIPIARVKRIIKLDDGVKMLAANTPVLFTKAVEAFIVELTIRSLQHTEESRRKTLQKSDIATATALNEQYDFLIDIVPKDQRALARRQQIVEERDLV